MLGARSTGFTYTCGREFAVRGCRETVLGLVWRFALRREEGREGDVVEEAAACVDDVATDEVVLVADAEDVGAGVMFWTYSSQRSWHLSR